MIRNNFYYRISQLKGCLPNTKDINALLLQKRFGNTALIYTYNIQSDKDEKSFIHQ